MRRRALIAALPLPLLAACAAQAPARRGVGVVFFRDDSAELAEQGLATVQEAARIAVANPTLPIRLLGYAAPATDTTPIAGLSRARAEAVAAELRRGGVAPERIRIEGRGPVPFEQAMVESRRVEMVLGN